MEGEIDLDDHIIGSKNGKKHLQTFAKKYLQTSFGHKNILHLCKKFSAKFCRNKELIFLQKLSVKFGQKYLQNFTKRYPQNLPKKMFAKCG